MTVSEPLEALIFVVWAVFALTVLGNILAFDKLVRLEYLSHRANWEEDGKPHGIFYHPPEASATSYWSRTKCAYAWVFSTPGWMRRDERALRSVFRLRIWTFVSFAALVGWIVLVFVSDGPPV